MSNNTHPIKPPKKVSSKISGILRRLVGDSIEKKERQAYYSTYFIDDPLKPHEILKDELSKPIILYSKELKRFDPINRRNINVSSLPFT